MAQSVKNVSKVINAIKEIHLEKDLSNYGKEFQMKFLSLLIKDRAFSISILPIVKNEYFTDIYLRKVFVVVQKFCATYGGTVPSMDNIRITLLQAGENMQVYDRILKSLEDQGLEDRDFVINNSRTFCFSKHALQCNEKIRTMLEEGDLDGAKAMSLEMFRFSGQHAAKILYLKKDAHIIYESAKIRQPISTPFPTFNEKMQGGPGAGNLVVMVAPSNFGKTNALVTIARHANAQRKTVVFFSFEIGGADILRRHVAGLTDLTQKEVELSEKMVMKRISDDDLGDFILIEERATNARISVMKNHLEYLKSLGIFPHMICVDSLNQLKLPIGMRYEGDNQKFEYLAEELRDWSNEEQVPLYTVYQTNRAGFGAEVNNIETIGKAIEPFQVADVVITFSQTPEMLEQMKCYTLLLKNRLGPKMILLDCYYDPDKCVFAEVGVVNELMLMSNRQKEGIKDTAKRMINKLKDQKPGDGTKKPGDDTKK